MYGRLFVRFDYNQYYIQFAVIAFDVFGVDYSSLQFLSPVFENTIIPTHSGQQQVLMKYLIIISITYTHTYSATVYTTTSTQYDYGNYTFDISFYDNNANYRYVPWYTLKAMGFPYQVTYTPPPFPHPIAVTFTPMNLTSGYVSIPATIEFDDVILGLAMSLLDVVTGQALEINFPLNYWT